jgi:pimeloyl-ACP methyl ester carboxylesterase
VRIAVDGQETGGKLLPSNVCEQPCPAVLFVHGWGSSQRHSLAVGKQLAARGYTCLTFNLRGHARTRAQRDTITRADNLRDVVAAYDLLVSRPEVHPGRVGVVGFSYGGYLATLLTTERSVRWLVLRAPALYMDADFDRPKRELNLDPKLGSYRRRRLAPADNRVFLAASRFEGHVLVVESEDDSVIPHDVVANYLRAFRAVASRRHEVIARADHGLSEKEWQHEWRCVLLDWLVKMHPENQLPSRVRARRARRVSQAAKA